MFKNEKTYKVLETLQVVEILQVVETLQDAGKSLNNYSLSSASL